MKKCKLLLSSLLIGLLVSTSCTERKDPSKDIVYDFSAYLDFPEDATSGKYNKFNLRLSSDVYKDGALEHEASFSDSKNSFLISLKGDTIKAGEKFSIPHLDEPVFFNFYSDDLGEHNLKFIFKNSMGFTINKDVKLPVAKGTFNASFNAIDKSVSINTPAKIEYKFIPTLDELKDYELMFEIDNPKLDATLNGHKAGEWFTISGHEGNLYYTPLTSGSHTVHVTVKNKEGVIKNASFVVVTNGHPVITSYEAGECYFLVQKKRDYNHYRFDSYYPEDIFKFSAYSGGDNLNISNINIETKVDGYILENPPGANRIKEDELIKEVKDSAHSSYSLKNFGLHRSDFSYNTKIEFKIEVVNSAGLKTELTIPIKIKDIVRETNTTNILHLPSDSWLELLRKKYENRIKK